MRKIWSITTGVLVFGVVATAAAQPRRLDPAVTKLPDGDGEVAVVQFCAGACHPAARFVDMRKSPEEWHKTVMSMVARGAQLFPEDVETLTNYLGTYLSDRSPPPAAK
jgi:hypothetical protein